MITAHYTIGRNVRGNSDNEYITREEDFATIDELENFLAYNRAYITELTFTGSINFLNEEDEN